MNLVLMIMSLVVLMSVLAGTVRVIRGPTAADRMLAALLFGTSGVAVLLLLARAMKVPALNDVALVFVVLAAVTTVAFVRLVWNPANRPETGQP
jgi:multicomponent Na+:H+ antiporter subunit F